MKKVLLFILTALALPALAQRPLGIDVSSYQGSIRWSTVAAAGINFAVTKATEGNYYQDAYFVGNMTGGKAAGIQMSCYHYARPDLDTPSTDATYFWNFAGPYLKHDGLTFNPMLDYETFNGLVGATSYTDWANQYGSDVATLASGAGVTVHCLIYISACNACDLDSSIALTPWIADWNGESYLTGTPWSTCTSCEEWGSGVWDFWQFTDKAHFRGVTGAVDEDTFNGTLSTLISSEGL